MTARSEQDVEASLLFSNEGLKLGADAPWREATSLSKASSLENEVTTGMRRASHTDGWPPYSSDPYLTTLLYSIGR